VVGLGYRPAQDTSPRVSAFHRQLLSVLPLMGLDRPTLDQRTPGQGNNPR